MKIIVVGGNGTIGKAVVNELKTRHTVLTAGREQGDIKVDIGNPDSIEIMYQSLNDVDAVIATVGKVQFGKFSEMTAKEYYVGLDNKLMGQVNLVLIGKKYLKPGSSFTLTSGILNHDPIVQGSSASMVNAALEGFVKAAAIEMPDSMRINLVSPTVIFESMPVYQAYFRGFQPAPAAQAALAYSKSVEGAQTGQVYRVGY